MTFLDRGIGQAVVGLALLWAIPAGAQENLYANKSPAQIFATDCGICHKTPQSLSKAGGPLGLGLEGFLRTHYTASRESAALMARYLQSLDAPAAAPEKKRGTPAAKPAAAKKPAAAALPGENKPVPASESKPAEAKPAEAKPAEAKPAEAKPAEPKSE